MPLPAPRKGEKQSHFVSRCISFETKASPGRNPAQIQAMCFTAWRGRGVSQDKLNVRKVSLMKSEKVDITNLTIVDLKASKIDKENNIINHVAILSDKAYDTNNEVFRTFTDRALSDAVEIFEGALARIDHDRDNQSEIESRGVRSGYGVYQNIRRESDKIFGDLHLWDCENARKVMSIAERTPHAVGNSIHAGGIAREDENGVEIIEQLTPRTKHGFKPSIDLVEDPAATINLFQNKRIKSKSKENDMDFKDLTMDLVRTNRPDLEKIFIDEGRKSRDGEVKDLIEERDKLAKERDELSKDHDELKVKQAKTEREVLVDRVLVESDLPDYAKTDAFRVQLLQVKEIKDGDKTTSVEDGIKVLIQDRIDVLEPDGVRDNTEKGISQSRNTGGKVSTEDFVDAFKQ